MPCSSQNLALRQQLHFLKRKHSQRLLAGFERLFRVIPRQSSSGWSQALIRAPLDTVARWHREGRSRKFRIKKKV
jgi:hypothetical protein